MRDSITLSFGMFAFLATNNACGGDGPSSNEGMPGDAAAFEAGPDGEMSDGLSRCLTPSCPDSATEPEAGDAGPADSTSEAATDSGICGAALVPRQPNAVVCGTLSCAVADPGINACVATMQGMVVGGAFCYTGSGPPPPGNPNGGNIYASCDGPEDCTGAHVCLDSAPGTGVLSTACGPRASGAWELCHDHTDCGSGNPLCCTAMLFQSGTLIRTPYGECTSAGAVPAGAQCDCP